MDADTVVAADARVDVLESPRSPKPGLLSRLTDKLRTSDKKKGVFWLSVLSVLVNC